MKKYLLALFFFITLFFATPHLSFAQTATPSATPSVPNGTWVADQEVTFVGKMGARAASFLDWSLQDYKWATNSAGLASFWIKIRNIIYAFFALVVLITAFVLIITQGKNITALQFIPRFLLIILLITFSFAIIQLIYQLADIFQGFFLIKSDGTLISQKDLLYLNFDYKSFIGYRLSGFPNDESAFMSLLLIRLTAMTYYLIGGILVFRKIVLWFFIIVSPVFPLLLLYSKARLTAKIWVGEFLRWVLYAPVFSILLGGLVQLWQSSQLPLKFNFSTISDISYPTAINILLGGPGQVVDIKNSLNVPDTFALYIVSLLMLWVITILPFILLQVFLGHMYASSWESSSTILKYAQDKIPFLKIPFLQPAGGTSSSNTFINNSLKPSMQSIKSNTIQSSNVNVSKTQTQDRSFSHPVTTNFVSPQTTNNASTNITHNIRSETSSFLPKSPIANFAGQNPVQVSQHDSVASHSSSIVTNQSGAHTTTHTVISDSKPLTPQTTMILPTSSEVGTPAPEKSDKNPERSKEDEYTDMKHMWEQTYKHMEPPQTLAGHKKDRKEWIAEDIKKLSDILELLTSQDEQKKHEGMTRAKTVFPFLFMGNFSQDKILAYVKAKLDAGKSVIDTIRDTDNNTPQVTDMSSKEESLNGESK